MGGGSHWTVSSSLHRPGLPQLVGSFASVALVMGLQVCVATLGLIFL